MKYRVRSKDGGEIECTSFGQVEQAWLMGLIEPDDELLEEGKTMWRKASSYPLLVQARRTGEQAWGGAWFLWIIIGVSGATIALSLLAQPDMTSKVGGVVLAFGVASLMFNVTQRASKRAKPHR